jgi:hypothetical protein
LEARTTGAFDRSGPGPDKFRRRWIVDADAEHHDAAVWREEHDAWQDEQWFY